MKEDMEMRGFSHWTKESYELKAKDVIRYFKKPMEEVTIEEFIRRFLLHKPIQSWSKGNYIHSTLKKTKVQ